MKLLFWRKRDVQVVPPPPPKQEPILWVAPPNHVGVVTAGERHPVAEAVRVRRQAWDREIQVLLKQTQLPERELRFVLYRADRALKRVAQEVEELREYVERLERSRRDDGDAHLPGV
jgi:DNA integrity scanning protein DisA with diadenylate cyclase activity